MSLEIASLTVTRVKTHLCSPLLVRLSIRRAIRQRVGVMKRTRTGASRYTDTFRPPAFRCALMSVGAQMQPRVQ